MEGQGLTSSCCKDVLYFSMVYLEEILDGKPGVEPIYQPLVCRGLIGVFGYQTQPSGQQVCQLHLQEESFDTKKFSTEFCPRVGSSVSSTTFLFQ